MWIITCVGIMLVLAFLVASTRCISSSSFGSIMQISLIVIFVIVFSLILINFLAAYEDQYDNLEEFTRKAKERERVQLINHLLSKNITFNRLWKEKRPATSSTPRPIKLFKILGGNY